MLVEPAVESPDSFKKLYERDYDTWSHTIKKIKKLS